MVSRYQRYYFLNSYGAFTCPENQFLSPEYNVSTGLVIRMPSYVTSMLFLLENPPKTKKGSVSDSDFQQYVNFAYYTLPGGYAPKLNKVGPSSAKIYIADGAKYSRPDTPPDYDVTWYSDNPGGTFSDYGAYAEYSSAMNREAAPGNVETYSPGPYDPRVYAYRHGNQSPFGKSNTYQFNAGFFDGHVETLGDLQGADPAYWMPTGTYLVNTEMTNDAKILYSSDPGNTGSPTGTTVR
jgi:prepilin-type processing-associated H-X9-DG protein